MRVIFSLIYVLVLSCTFGLQDYLIRRVVSTSLAACCSAPVISLAVRQTISPMLYMWKVAFILAVIYPVVELAHVCVRRVVGGRKN